MTFVRWHADMQHVQQAFIRFSAFKHCKLLLVTGVNKAA